MNLKHLFRPAKDRSSIESRAIYFATASGVLSFLVALGYFWSKQSLPIFGLVSIGTTSIILSTLAGFVAYFYVTNQLLPQRKQASLAQRLYRVVNLLSLSFIHAAIVFLLVTVAFFVVSEAFVGATIDKYASSVIVAATVGLSGYVLYLVAYHRNAMMVSSALAIFLVTGVLTSMITTQDPYWWQYHLSSLGTGGGVAPYAFNLTLIIGGAVVSCIADLIADDFAKLGSYDAKYRRAKATAIRTLLVLIGIFLAGVGLFPVDKMLTLHNISASGMVVLFLILIIGLKPFAPMLSRAFFMFTYAVMAAMVACIFLFSPIQYFDLTSFELVCFVLVFSWLVVFIRQIAAETEDALAVKTKTTPLR